MEGKEYKKNREKLVKIIGQINSVANSEGNGRDDLEIQILDEAEKALRRISSTQSKALRALAERVKKTFDTIRMLFRKYETNIEVVDP
jgi:replicative DNA helicase